MLVLALACTSAGASDQAEVTLRAEWDGSSRLRVRVPIHELFGGGDLSLVARFPSLADLVSTIGGQADGATSLVRTADSLRVAYRSAVVAFGPLALRGALAELASPVGQSAASGHWEAAPGARVDTGLSPPGRAGVALYAPYRVGLAAWEDRVSGAAIADAGADAAWAALQSAALLAHHRAEWLSATAIVAHTRRVAPHGASDASSEGTDWFGFRETQDVSHALVGVGMRRARFRADAAAALSLPELTLPGAWVRAGAAFIAVPSTLQIRLYGALVTPAFLDLRLRSPGTTGVASTLFQATIGPVTSTAGAEVVARWHPAAALVVAPPVSWLAAHAASFGWANRIAIGGSSPRARLGVTARAGPFDLDRFYPPETGASPGAPAGYSLLVDAEVRVVPDVVTASAASTLVWADGFRHTERISVAITADRLIGRVVPGSTLRVRLRVDIDAAAATPLVPAGSVLIGIGTSTSDEDPVTEYLVVPERFAPGE